MKILWVKAGGLVPPDTGGKIRSYNILRELARQHSVTFFSFYATHENDAHPDLKNVFDRVVCVPLSLPAPKSFGEALDYGVRLLSSQPYNITKYCRAEVRRRLHSLLKQETYDVIVCDFMVAAGVLPWDWSTPKVLFTHNVEATIWRRHYQVATNPVWKALSWLEWRRMEGAERRYLRLADRVLTVSETDRDAFVQFLSPEKLTVIPTGVDVDYFQLMPAAETPDSLVFTGSMDWLPNEDAIVYFVDAILPLIKKQCPGISLEVVGRSPSRKLLALAETEKSIRLTGWVEDIRPYLARGSVCIVPLRIGGGTRLKIFEAMAMGKAVVSTTVGAEGLPVSPGENILLADTPSDFADAVAALFRDPEQRQRLGTAARTLVQENYSWQKVAENFARTLADVIPPTDSPTICG
ncbi:MAG TPA: glycosyltransferase [Candidatus Dormibacteraeota bacterium]|jgi:sugar transferase (PEP-CTERM/EpsH1 system associated)|nr:glycosyltransferase [Candidatus Dormibacteraeota bacterium]